MRFLECEDGTLLATSAIAGIFVHVDPAHALNGPSHRLMALMQHPPAAMFILAVGTEERVRSLRGVLASEALGSVFRVGVPSEQPAQPKAPLDDEDGGRRGD